jgi:hypothetical protein
MNFLGARNPTNKNINRLTQKAIGKRKNFCETFPFDKEPKNKSTCAAIPHLETIEGTQVALGRIATLTKFNYYKCPRFATLTMPYKHEVLPGNLYWTIRINDLFTYCAARRRQRFPIRLVVDPAPNGSPNRVTTKSITWREEQQLLRYFGMFKYQSKTHPNIFFFSKFSDIRMKGIVRSHTSITSAGT